MATASVTNTFTNGTAADAIEVNTNFADLVTFLNNSVVHVDGTKAFSAAQAMGGNKLTGLAAATANGDAVRFEQAVLHTLADAKGDILAATAADVIARLAVGANGTILTADSAEATGLKWATGVGGAYVYKTADETVNGSTTLQDDDHLFFTTEANGIYAFEVFLSWSAGAAGAGPQVLWVEPDGTFDLMLTWTADATLQTTVARLTEASAATAIHGSAVVGVASFRGLIEAGGAGGTFKLQWAQHGSSGTDTKLLKGSWLSYKKLN